MQTKPAGGGNAAAQVDHPAVQNVLSSPGQPLDTATRSFMEPRFGQDFSGVRVHTDGQAAESARAVNARAYTVGRDVVFGAGQYALGSSEGRRLMAHELVHVGQQGRVDNILNRKEHGQLSRVPHDMIGSCDQIASSTPGIAEEQKIPDVQYAIESSQLDDSIVLALNQFASDWYSAGANATIKIFGYASIDGAEEYNWRLSCRRANSVKNVLLHPTDGQPGIPRNNIVTNAQGETDKFGDRLTENRVATIVSTVHLNPSPPPTPKPPPPAATSKKCGPDITSALNTMLGNVATYFHGLGSYWRKRRSCMVLDPDVIFTGVNPIMAWDTKELFLPNTCFLDSYFSSAGCGSPRNPGCASDPTRHLCETVGTCGNTVLVGGKCMLAGTANYALYGKMFKLCHDEFSPDFPRWDMRAMIWLWKTVDRDDPEPPRAMASAVFDGTFPTVSASAENRAYCNARCGRTHSGSFDFVWEPYRPR